MMNANFGSNFLLQGDFVRKQTHFLGSRQMKTCKRACFLARATAFEEEI
jgi:hypothetical protein